MGFLSLVCVALSLLIMPVVFGSLGVVAGMVAIWKGDEWLGAASVFGSTVAAVVGYFLASGVVS